MWANGAAYEYYVGPMKILIQTVSDSENAKGWFKYIVLVFPFEYSRANFKNALMIHPVDDNNLGSNDSK
jgi:hypothetical protein